MAGDYGPVPISRFKEESSRIFAALEAGRRVLVSRSGDVIAAIEPATRERHLPLLASFALPHAPDPIAELSATMIGQGSPSRAVRAAEAGVPSLITRNNKVYGVLTAPQARMTLEAARASEQLLSGFEEAHPDASPEEFMAFASDVDAMFADVEPPSSARNGTDPLLVETLVQRGSTLMSQQDHKAAEATLLSVIHRFGHDQNSEVQRGVAKSMVALAKLYSAEDRDDEAIKLLDEALVKLEIT